MEIVFLGSGGGRFVTIHQVRGTGGFIISDELNFFVDPGPGAFIKYLNYFNKRIDGIFVSHVHIDHSSDVSIMLEVMTNGMTKRRGFLAASKSVFELLNPYQLKNIKESFMLVNGDEIGINTVKVLATPTVHKDNTCVGFKFFTQEGVISYTSDTQYFETLGEYHKDARVLIMNITRPTGARIPYHLSTEDAVKLVKEVQPEIAVMIHLGMKMHPVAEVERLKVERETGVKTIIGSIGKKLYISEKIKLQETLW